MQESIVVCVREYISVREFEWNGREFEWYGRVKMKQKWVWFLSSWLADRRGGSYLRSKYCAVISHSNFQRFCYAAFAPKIYLVACSRGRLSLREAFSCDRQFILNRGQSLRVLEGPETSEKLTQAFRIHKIIHSIKSLGVRKRQQRLFFLHVLVQL